MARVYVPATLPVLREYVAAGRIPADADRVVAPGEDEESEYAALMTAADLSAEAQEPGARRVVLAVVTAATAVEGELRWSDVVAVHADPGERAADADPDEDLAWYATQEVPELLGPGTV